MAGENKERFALERRSAVQRTARENRNVKGKAASMLCGVEEGEPGREQGASLVDERGPRGRGEGLDLVR